MTRPIDLMVEMCLLIAGLGSSLNAQSNTKPAPLPPNASAADLTPSTSRPESSLFYFLNMAGKTQADFKPLTAGEKARFYSRGLVSPVTFFIAGAAAGVSQAENVPRAWGQGADGFGERFGNYMAKQAVGRTVRLGLEEMLHEDNRYFASGEQGFGRRIGYALKSSIMARGNDGRQHLSLSEIGSVAGSAFISRLWQPASDSSAGDGAVSFGIGMASNAGVNILREFLPDVTRHIFHRHEASAEVVGDLSGVSVASR